MYIVKKGFGDKLFGKSIKSPEDIKRLRDRVDNILCRKPISDRTYCSGCDNYRIAVKNFYVCDNCGEVVYGPANEFIPNIWMHTKSKHSRRRWITKYAKGLVEPKYIDIVVNDFIKIVSEISKSLNHISRYGYYVIRIASHRGIPLKRKITDLKLGRNKRIFDDRLFGLYKSFGWGNGCPYYEDWLKQTPKRK